MSTRSLLITLVSLVLFVCADVRGASSLRRYAPVRVTIDAPAVDAAPEQHEPEVFDAFTWLLNATLSWQEHTGPSGYTAEGWTGPEFAAGAWNANEREHYAMHVSLYLHIEGA